MMVFSNIVECDYEFELQFKGESESESQPKCEIERKGSMNKSSLQVPWFEKISKSTK